MGILILLLILVASFSVASATDGNFYKINFKKPNKEEQGTERDFSFASYYQSNMVLQMEPHSVIIWGYGTIGATVNISVNMLDIYTTKVVEGYEGYGVWSVKVKPQRAGATAAIQGVQDNHGVLKWILLENLLFGDVYVCSGQSNMQLTMSMVLNSSYELNDTYNYPNVRVFTVAEYFSPTPVYDIAHILQPWSVPSPETIGGKDWTYFSAVCWLYGKYLYDKLKIPIGLVATTWGGTPVESWSPPAVFEVCNESLSHQEEEPMLDYSCGFRSCMDNSQLFNAMIHPLLNMTIKGVVWYQGEQNTVTNTNSYQCMFPNMIKSWRKEWYAGSQMTTEPDFPFGFVQLCDKVQDSPTDKNYAIVRWHQTADFGFVPNPDMERTFMAVTIDLPDPHSPYASVHTRDKQDVARRLVAGALSVVYHQTSVYDGPFPEKIIETKDHKVVIQYSTYQQLQVQDLGHFQICCQQQNCSLADTEDDEKWHTTKILEHTDHTITLDAKSCNDDFKMVDKVRYAWALTPCSFKACSVYNTLQFPGAPFFLQVLHA